MHGLGGPGHPGGPGTRTTSRAVDIGVSYKGLRQRHQQWVIERTCDDYPALMALVVDATRQLSPSLVHPEGRRLCNWDRVNVLVRYYSKGERIKHHIDRTDLFEDNILGCILDTNSGVGVPAHGLTFLPEGSGPYYSLRETPGTTYLIQGEARERWSHGVWELPPGGRRLSVTWRWVHAHVQARLQGGPPGASSKAPPQAPPPALRRPAGRWPAHGAKRKRSDSG